MKLLHPPDQHLALDHTLQRRGPDGVGRMVRHELVQLGARLSLERKGLGEYRVKAGGLSLRGSGVGGHLPDNVLGPVDGRYPEDAPQHERPVDVQHREPQRLIPPLPSREDLQDVGERLIALCVVPPRIPSIEEYGAIDVVKGAQALQLQVVQDAVLEVVERVGPELQLAPGHRLGRRRIGIDAAHPVDIGLGALPVELQVGVGIVPLGHAADEVVGLGVEAGGLLVTRLCGRAVQVLRLEGPKQCGRKGEEA